jgi:hypothetical protein
MRLRGFLGLLAAHGGGEMRACDLEAALADDGREARSALRAQGVVRDAARALTVPCDGLGCAREVRELPRASDGTGERRFFGVCTREPEACELIEVHERELAQVLVSREALVAAVQRALKITPPLAHESCADVLSLGEEITDGDVRDVWLAWRHDSPALHALLGDRASAARGTRILFLTPPAEDAPLLARYAADARIAFDALTELLTVRDGQIAELPRLKVVPAARPGAAETMTREASPVRASPLLQRSPALDGLREWTRWGEITLFDVDDEALLGVCIDDRLRRLSCVDFHLASVDGRKPLAAFDLLKTICRGSGLFTTRAYGSRDNGKRLVSDVRKALVATFAIESDPFERYSFRDRCWKVKFRALAAPPKVIASATREHLGSR